MRHMILIAGSIVRQDRGTMIATTCETGSNNIAGFLFFEREFTIIRRDWGC